MKKKAIICSLVLCAAMVCVVMYFISIQNNTQNTVTLTESVSVKGLDVHQKNFEKRKKSSEERTLFTVERLQHEFNLQRNPQTNSIPKEEKLIELDIAKRLQVEALTSIQTEAIQYDYTSRGPSNLGGRTRALVIDALDVTGNTMIAGGVSGGVFRTTNGGADWTMVSDINELHNVTALAQDPRPGFQNIWYYGTGEIYGNSASLPFENLYLGDGIWQSLDSGLTWNQIPVSSGNQTMLDSDFDLISDMEVHPITGDLYIAGHTGIFRYDGTNFSTELVTSQASNTTYIHDVEISSTGRVYASLYYNNDFLMNGVWTLPNGVTGTANWTQVAANGNPTGWFQRGRCVIAVSPSNENILYALYVDTGLIEADLWRYDATNDTWTDYSFTLPDEPGGNLAGNDPFATQGGYDLVISVKPDDENYVVIGGTNVYRIDDITTDSQFTRIGGYNDNQSYNQYNTPSGDAHHPDIHVLEFDPINPDVLVCGSDGGIHRTVNVNATTVNWTNLNNNYQTYQFYHVAQNNDANSFADAVLGGTQDNGTVAGGTSIGFPDDSTMSMQLGGDGVAVGISNDDDCLPFFMGFQNGPIYRDCPGGFVQVNPSNSGSQFVTYFYLDPDNNNALYYAGNNTVYRTTNSTIVTQFNWDNLGTTAAIPNGVNQIITVYAGTRGTYNPATSYLLIGGNNGNIYRLNDPQNASSLGVAVDITPADVMPGSYVSSLAVHPSNNDIVMATLSNYDVNSIFMTTDASSANPTWTLVERNLSNFSARATTIAEFDGETKYFVGTARGLYSSPDPLTTDWSQEAPNEIGLAVISALRYRTADSKVLIGTHGNGMWEAIVDETFSVSDIAAQEFKVFPNPVQNNAFTIQAEVLKNTSAKITLYSLNGQRVFQDIVEANDNGLLLVEPMQQISAGQYILKIEYANKSFATQILFK